MLHKTDSLIVADFILRMLRSDKRLKYIDGFIKPFVNNIEHGYSIDLIRLDSQYSISFALESSGQIVVYIDNSALSLLDGNFQNKKLFNNDCFTEAKDYIVNAIVCLIKNCRVNNIDLKYDLL